MKTLTLGILTATLLLAAGPARADEPERPWTDTAEFSLVSTTGNTETESFAFANKFVYTWPQASFTLDASALRVNTTFPGDPVNRNGKVTFPDRESKTTAAAYNLDGKYRRTIREGFHWYAGAAWDRNRPLGIDDRTTISAGVGYLLFKDDRHSLLGEVGADYTDESRVGGDDDSFAGARAYLGYERTLSETSKLTSELELLENLDDTSDLRGSWVTSVTASLTSKMALKMSYTVLYDAQPVEILVPGDDPGERDAWYEYDKTDTILTASLVINF
jgi:putative salt-induced outer membrane protein YdiY